MDNFQENHVASQRSVGRFNPQFWRKRLEIEVKGGSNVVGTVRHNLTADKDFERVIAAAEGLIAGDDPPEIQAWEYYPGPAEDGPIIASRGIAPRGGGGRWQDIPPTRTSLSLPPELRNRGLVAKALLLFIERAVKGNLAFAEGTIFGIWDGLKGDVLGVADTVRLAAGGWDDVAIFIDRYLKDPLRITSELSAAFEAASELGWDGITSNVKAMVAKMFSEFIGNQKDRLKLALGDECEDPTYLTAYLAGYAAGYVGEQVAVTFFTAGLAKSGVIAKVLRAGGGAVETLMKKAAAKFPAQIVGAGGELLIEGVHIQKQSKGFFGEFAGSSKDSRNNKCLI